MLEDPEEIPAPELVVVTAPEARVVVPAPDSSERPTAASQDDLDDLLGTVHRAGAVVESLFGDTLRQMPGLTGAAAELQHVIAVKSRDPDSRTLERAELEELADSLLQNKAVTAAYVAPPPLPPASTTTQDFTARQGYLDPAPDGIDARHAWTIGGGDGSGVTICDIEQNWRFSHEDLAENSLGFMYGTAPNSPLAPAGHHGTAVLGELGGDAGSFGVTGICPAASLGGIPSGSGAWQAILAAALTLQAGDLLLLEMHSPGPRHNFAFRKDQLGYIAVEWWPVEFLAISMAVEKGIIVVAAAGNGNENLDDALYDTAPKVFGSSWRNPFRRQFADSGAILVGAGAPPSGNFGPDRSRLDFSNYGSCVDAQGWGREVVTTGYGDLYKGPTMDAWYTESFAGTSSASPIVTGALACVQGALRAAGLPLLAPWRARQLLRATGTPQQDHPARPATERIGRRPDVKELLPKAMSESDIPVTQVATESWSPGWTSHVPFVHGGEQYMLSYKARNYQDPSGTVQTGGRVIIAKFDPSTQTFASTTFEDRWTTGWEKMLVTYLDGGPHLFSYKPGVKGDTNASIDRLESGGSGTASTYVSVWDPDWAAFAAYYADGAMQLLCYRPAGGSPVRLFPFLSDGSGFDGGPGSTGWEDGLTDLVVVYPFGVPHLFTYQAAQGGIGIDRLETAGSHAMTFREQMGREWKNLCTLLYDNEPYLLSYRPDLGLMLVNRVLPDGGGLDTRALVNINTDWTTVTAFNNDSGAFVFSYDAISGNAAYWKLG